MTSGMNCRLSMAESYNHDQGTVELSGAEANRADPNRANPGMVLMRHFLL